LLPELRIPKDPIPNITKYYIESQRYGLNKGTEEDIAPKPEPKTKLQILKCKYIPTTKELQKLTTENTHKLQPKDQNPNAPTRETSNLLLGELRSDWEFHRATSKSNPVSSIFPPRQQEAIKRESKGRMVINSRMQLG
jgi:hypothetical protein